jgi:NADPH:quinone reductase-like Zn-dependent oxidoreductase
VSRAVVVTGHGGPEVLACVDTPPQAPGPGELRVAVRAAGVNPIEGKIRRGEVSGLPAQFPGRLGTDVAGVVDAVGDGVTAFTAGEEVLGRAADGGYADFAICRVEDMVAKPPALAWDVAGSLAIPAETAVRVLGLVGCGPGEAARRTVVVHAASGGVGLITAQLALARGARVVGTAGPERLAYLRSLGIAATPYGPGWVERVRALAPEGVDAVLDLAGKGVLEESLALVGDPSAVVTIADPDAARLGVRYSRGLVERVPMPEVFAEVLPLILDERIRVPIARRFPLVRAADAHRFCDEGHPGGRIVLLTGEEDAARAS